ncbi:MAG TPA: hypothetical protein VGB03_01465 [Acidimicrobiales bacterium]|jgi:hypothetical protein
MDAIKVIDRLRREQRQPRELRPSDAQLADVRRLTWQLPVVVAGRWSTAVPLGNADAALRLQAAMWELASTRHLPLGPHATTPDVAALLAEQGALAPGAARAAAILAGVLATDGYDVEACRLAARLIAHLELRARFG